MASDRSCVIDKITICEEYIISTYILLVVNGNLRTRQFDKLVLRVFDVRLYKTMKAPIYAGAKLWNELPQNVQESPTYTEFKWRVKMYLSHQIQHL